jgi:hypothetical protein
MNYQILANPIVSQFVGLAVGLFTSFFSWWVLFRWMAPTISLSDQISKTESKHPAEDDEDKSGWRYRIKIENSGRRPVIDLQVRAWARIRGLNDPNSTIWEVVHLPFNTDGGLSYTIPLMNPVRKSKLRTRLRICLNHTDYPTKAIFPQTIRDKAIRRELILEDLLSLGTASEVRVVVSGYDEFTGARKIFQKIYLPSNIKKGEFERAGLSVVDAPNEAMQPSSTASS